MGRKSVHVTYRKDDGKWHITNGTNGQSSGQFSTQKEAMSKARKMAMESSSEFCVHGRDGKIRLSTSYSENGSSNNKRQRSSNKTQKRSSSRSSKSK